MNPSKTVVYNKKVITGWAMYDWANSAYNLVITSTIFPAYYIAVTRNPSLGDKVSFFGWDVINTALLDYSLAAAYLIIALLSPMLSSMADFRGNKKAYMKLFCYLGSAACIGLYFFNGSNVELGIIFSMIAAIGYCGSLVFYNSYLPEIAPAEIQDKVSAQGFAYGYIGSVLLQLVCFAFIFMPFEDGTFAPRLSFLLVGVWWLLFSQITFKRLPNSKPIQSKLVNPISNGVTQLKEVFNEFKHLPKIKWYLWAFFCYSTGVQTVMLAAALFGSKEVMKEVNGEMVHMESEDLIPAIILIQIVAIGGAMMMAALSKKIGNLNVLIITVLAWIGICVGAYFTFNNYEFYVLAFTVGIVMGGVQSMSRSTYSKLIPQNTENNTSYFSFYDVVEKLSIVVGMFSFGFIEHITGNMRNSILMLGLFFVLGLGLLLYTKLVHKRLGVNDLR